MNIRWPFGIVILCLLSATAFSQSLKTDAWLEDFSQIRREMSGHYANLEWAVEERQVDLKKLTADTEERIRTAPSEAMARAAIESFLRAFGDGHLRVEWTPPVQAPQSTGTKLCERLGFAPRPTTAGIEFSTLSGFQMIESNASKYIPAGFGTLPTGKRFGIVRIGRFMETAFPGLCEDAAAELELTAESLCDDKCEDKLRYRASDLFTAALAAQVEQLKASNIDVLVVDITGNGGGNDVYQAMARILTAKPLRTSASGFVRHPHWAAIHKEALTDLESEIPKATPAMTKRLKDGAESVRRNVAEAEKSCDLSPLWENQKVNCSIVAMRDKHSPNYAKPGELSNTALGRTFFGVSQYSYREGVYRDRLVVLIDARTASSSEAFASMLRDNGAATIVGQPSLGAGCGYSNGGIPVTLKNSGARVRMPDCIRFRADGTNEINGIDPDVTVHWRSNDSPFQKARRTISTIGGLVK